MKEGWEVKKIKDICDKATSNIAQNKLLGMSGDYPVFGASGYVQNVDFYHRDKPYIGVVKDGSGVGRVNIYPAFSSILGTLQYILPKKGYLIGYVAYALKGLNLEKFASGAAIPHIYFKDYGEKKISVPPLPEQSRIVEELDLLSNIIEKKRQQLSELDNLAQSIFYDMFGDPVTNEKGWEVKLIGEISTFYNGKAHEKNIVEDSGFLLVNAKFISSCGDIKKYSDMQLFPLYKNDITMVMSDLPNGKTLAKCYLIEKDDTYTLNQRICAFRGYKQNPIFLKYVLNRNKYYLSFDDGNGQTNLRKSDVVNCPIILPPLSLQQLFAKKIEAIEQQKALIKQSITETQELFNCRMDYYFN